MASTHKKLLAGKTPSMTQHHLVICTFKQGQRHILVPNLRQLAIKLLYQNAPHIQHHKQLHNSLSRAGLCPWIAVFHSNVNSTRLASIHTQNPACSLVNPSPHCRCHVLNMTIRAQTHSRTDCIGFAGMTCSQSSQRRWSMQWMAARIPRFF